MNEEPKAPNPWERLPCDNEESWEAFRHFRDQIPPRRVLIPGMTSQAKRSQWQKENSWHERVRAYDAHMDEIRIQEREAVLKESTRDVAAKHMALLADVRELAHREATKLLEASRTSKGLGLLKPEAITKMIEATIKLDRLVRNETTENTAPAVPDMSKLSDEEIQEMERLMRKLQGGT